MKRLPVLLCSLAPLLALGGCTVPVLGSTGVGMNADGSVVGYLAVCEQHIDGVTLYAEDKGGSSGDGPDTARWSFTEPVTSATSWSFDGTSPGLTTELDPGDLDPKQTYSLYGWTRDDSSSAATVTFTLEQLEALEPGQVLYFGGPDEQNHRDTQRVGSPADFRTFACAP